MKQHCWLISMVLLSLFITDWIPRNEHSKKKQTEGTLFQCGLATTVCGLARTPRTMPHANTASPLGGKGNQGIPYKIQDVENRNRVVSHATV